jgi:hypothetical protein
MNLLGLVARIVAAVALLGAFVLSFVSRFLVVSIDIEGLEGDGITAGVSAWHRMGVLGALCVLAGLALAIVSAVLPTQVSVVRRLLAGLASLMCCVSAGLFVLFLILQKDDVPQGAGGFDIGFGWSAFAVLALLAVGMLAGLVGAIVADRPAARVVQTPPWA